MATDFFVGAFFWPVIGLSVIIILVAILLKSSPVGVGFIKIGVKRVAFGFVGILLATLIVAYINAYTIGVRKVELGHIPADELFQRLLNWGLYLYVLLTPFVLVGATILGLPMLALFSRIGFTSFVGVIIIAIVFSVIFSLYTYLNPYNLWCGSNLLECTQKSFVKNIYLAVPVAIGFSIAARLPLLKVKNAT